MKRLLATLSVGALLVCQSASANMMYVLGEGNDFPVDQISTITGNTGLGDANVLAWLQAEIILNQFPAPTTAQSDYAGGPIAAGDYLVLHYGVGDGGISTAGGGLVALYFDADQASFDVPLTGSGPNGLGGLSFARLFDHTDQVPDGGSTAAILGLGLLALAGSRRFMKR